MIVKIVDSPMFYHEGEQKFVESHMFGNPEQFYKEIEKRIQSGANYLYLLDSNKHPIQTNKEMRGFDIYFLRYKFVK